MPFPISGRLVGAMIGRFVMGTADDRVTIEYLWSKVSRADWVIRNGILPMSGKNAHYQQFIDHLTMPILNIHSSPTVDRISAEQFTRLLPDGTIKCLEATAHFNMYHCAGEFNRIMARFLDAHETSTSL